MEDQQTETAIEQGRASAEQMLTMRAAAERHNACARFENRVLGSWSTVWHIARQLEAAARAHPGEPLPEWARVCMEAAEGLAWDKYTEAASRSAAALAVYEGAVKEANR